MKRLLNTVVALAAVACGGSSDGGGTAPPANGPLALVAISGDKQVVAAGSHDSLPMPVVFRVVQSPAGTTALIHALPDRFLDLLVPRAAAQGSGTTADGTPVAGASVCAHEVAGYHALTPLQTCVTSDNNGLAYLLFAPDTLAGLAAVEISATKDGHTPALDTATATVVPGPATWIAWKETTLYAGRPAKLGNAFIGASDKYGNPIVPESLTFAPVSGVTISHDTVTAGLPERKVVLTPSIGGELDAFVVRDFRNSPLKIQSVCVFPGNIHNSQNVPIDSELVNGTVDSVTYTPDNLAQPSGGVLWFSAAVWDYLHTGEADSTFASPIPFQFVAQRPDTLYINSRPGAYQNDGMIETSSSPLTYVSATHCWQGTEPFSGYVTLSAR